MLTDDGNTWTAELQNGGEFNNEETFAWINKFYNVKGVRTITNHYKQMEFMGI
jgi:hypothetical protein